MPKKNSDYKIKLLVLYEILKQNTDENHKLTTKELIAMLAKKGISCDRKILYNDIATLNENGFEILSTRGQQMEYYVPEAAFDNYELRILVDAVQAAKFISKKKTEELENKIISLHEKIKVRVESKLKTKDEDGKILKGIVETTAGRLIFNEIIPQDLGFVDRTDPKNEFEPEINKLVKK